MWYHWLLILLKREVGYSTSTIIIKLLIAVQNLSAGKKHYSPLDVQKRYRLYAFSPCWLSSRPITSSSASTLKPTIALMIMNITNVITAL